jgi:ribose transport system ATP-binding protein
MSDAPPLLDVRGLSKRFAGTLALADVDIAFHAGEVHALLGENGAGKSTLIKVLAGVHAADAGELLWRGQPVRPDAQRLAISFIHQDLGLVDSMTVAENIAVVAGYPRRRGLIGLIDWGGARAVAADVLGRMGGGVSPDARVATLPASGKSIVAIARALAVRCDLLVLDEPTAALPEADVARLLDVLRRLRAEGIGIVYVTHRLDEVFRIADRVTVLRDGRRIATSSVAATTPAALVQAIIGRRLDDLFATPPAASGGGALRVRALAGRGVGPVSFDVAAGEVVGLVGLRGAGHDTVGRMIFGDIPAEAGTVTLGEAAVQATTPRAAIAHRIGFVSSKRREESVAPSLTVRENLFMNPTMLGAGTWHPIGPAAERARTGRVLQRLSVRPPDTERPIVTLSGGNQQKVVLSRWLEAGSRLLVLEEPTFGVDVGSKSEIYRLLRTALAEGLAILLVSSDFEEVAGLCHRALVLDRGRVVAELPRAALSVERLTQAASGGEAHAA